MALLLLKPYCRSDKKKRKLDARFVLVIMTNQFSLGHEQNHKKKGPSPNHRYPKLTRRRIRNIMRLCMGILAIFIQGTKIEIKIHHNFLPCCLVIFMVYSQHFWPELEEKVQQFDPTLQCNLEALSGHHHSAALSITFHHFLLSENVTPFLLKRAVARGQSITIVCSENFHSL